MRQRAEKQGGRSAGAYLVAAGLAGLGLGAFWAALFRSVGSPPSLVETASVILVAFVSTVALAAIPAALAIRLIRRAGWKRGPADGVAGAIIAAILSVAVFLFFEGVFANFRTMVTPRSVAGVLGLWLAPNVAAGYVAGRIYAALAAPRDEAD